MKKIVSKILLAGLLSAFAVSSAFAATAAKSEISPNQGSDACGLGWQVTQNKTLFGTSTRGTTNYFLPAPFSMTSGTSGCEQHPIAKNDAEAVKYVASNFYSLRADMAQGQGEYLEGLARMMGCGDDSVAGFGAATQQNFKSITRGADAFEMLQNVRKEIRKNGALAHSCGLVS